MIKTLEVIIMPLFLGCHKRKSVLRFVVMDENGKVLNFEFYKQDF